MLNKLVEAEIRQACKERLESLERWLRRLIHDKLVEAYGSDYFKAKKNGSQVIKTEISKNVFSRLEAEADRYARPVDALILEEETKIICRADLYKDHFSESLKFAFPQGNEVAATFLGRLHPPRNKLSHAHAISEREAEQVLCYSGDIISSLKQYYVECGMKSEYNAPSITRIVDSFGNEMLKGGGNYCKTPNSYLWPGDQLTLICEVDAAFSPEEYEVKWYTSHGMYAMGLGNGPVLTLKVDKVSEIYPILCRVISNKSWHRHGDWDDTWTLHYKVLPPPEG